MKTRIILLAVLIMSTITLNAQTIMNIHQSNGTVMQIPVNIIDSIAYSVLIPNNLATLTTLPITNLTDTTASSGGNITDDGGSLITQRGIVWSTSPNPTIADNFTSEGSGTGSFSSNLTGLIAGNTYYLRAYATNSAGTAYGNELSFYNITSNSGQDVTYNGYTYPTIILGNGQEWMAHNLRTTQYNDGTSIPLVTDEAQWAVNDNIDSLPMMCWYFNDQFTYTANNFGALYNWYAVNPLTNGNKNVCPSGWHVPTDSEWSTFINYLDPNADGGNNNGNGNIAGGKMKSSGTQYWQSPNNGASNESGFSGLPSGCRGSNGAFNANGIICLWWCSSEYSPGNAWQRQLGNDSSSVSRGFNNKGFGFSVRCLKD
jgi:uncharacterized protein (TIGR02145 family)